MEVSWETRPQSTTDGQVLLQAPTTTTQNYENIDVTGLIQELISTPAENHGLLLKFETPSFYQKIIFASSDAADSTLWPQLTILLEEETELLSYEEVFGDTICHTVMDTSSCIVEIPNVFTPNGDGQNDFFRLLATDGCILQESQLRIYNRWGAVVYSSSGDDTGWDGRYRGKDAPTEAYFYLASFRLPGGELKQKQGSLHLIR